MPPLTYLVMISVHPRPVAGMPCQTIRGQIEKLVSMYSTICPSFRGTSISFSTSRQKHRTFRVRHAVEIAGLAQRMDNHLNQRTLQTS